RRDFAVLTGSGAHLQAALGAGAVGGILAVALFAPELSLALYERTLARDDVAAATAQARLAVLASTSVGSLGVAGVKAAMDAVGLHGGPVRSPLRPLSAPNAAKVRELLAQGVRAAAS
ncbi:MAG: hypothetical protein B7Z72_04235, partial [Gemmatimonadetes bacterium 21-71-4]